MIALVYVKSINPLYQPNEECSGIHSIIDPKLIVQECWKRNLDWDDPLPCDLLSRFEKWQKEKNKISKDIKVPCFYSFNQLKGDTVRFSSWRKLVRHFTWIKLESVPSILNSDLLKDSARVIISLILSETFSMEVKHICNNFPVPNNSKLQQLNPIISENVLKVNGKLKHSNLPTELNHPIILPSDRHITQITIGDIHENSLHAGRDHTLAISRAHY